MTRRQLLAVTVSGASVLCATDPDVVIPVLRLFNKHASCSAAELHSFYAEVWAEAERAFRLCGVTLRTVDRIGEIRHYPGGRPRFFGLEAKMINVVFTDRIPLDWDNGRSLAGISTICEGHHLSVIAMKNAHPNRVPFLAVNTVVHELLHVFLGDIFTRRKGLVRAEARELAVDWHATRLWFFRYSAGIRDCARAYLQRLTAEKS